LITNATATTGLQIILTLPWMGLMLNVLEPAAARNGPG